MALSPNAPDYVSQVRGVINDLREDYLKKQQLFQQEQQANASLALNYAQLQANRENAQRQAAVEQARLEASKLDDLRQMQRDQYTIDRAMASDQLARDRLAFDQQKEINELQVKRMQEDRDTLANTLENKFRIAYEKQDPNELSKVMDEIGNSNLQTAQRTALYNNVYGGIQKKRELEQYELNLRTAPQADALTKEVFTLNPANFTPDQYSQTLRDYSDRFSSLGNKDENTIRAFSTAMTKAAENGAAFREGAIGSMVNSFVDIGEQGRLEPTYQKAYDELKNRPGGASIKAIQGLAFKQNKERSIAQLKATNDRFARNLENMVKQNPDLAVINVDPITGERYRSFTYTPPDLTPVEGYNGTIDPDTGLITKRAEDQIKKFEDEVISPSYLTGQVPVIRGYQRQQAEAPLTPSSTETAGLPFRATPSRFETVAAGPTAVIPTAPPAPPAAAISPDTIRAVVDAYNANPNGTYAGRPVREVIGRLQARGIQLPGLRGQAVAEGQEQKR